MARKLPVKEKHVILPSQGSKRKLPKNNILAVDADQKQV